MRPYLVQRLIAPQDTLHSDLVSGLAFGGGLRFGGLSADIMKMLKPVFRFDYMGAAEFEFGQLRDGMALLAGAISDGVAVTSRWDFDAPAPVECRNQAWVYPAVDTARHVSVRAHVIARSKSDLPDIESFIRNELDVDKGGTPSKQSTMERTCIWSGLTGFDASVRATIGGFDIQNGWFWFASKDVFVRTCTVFGVDPGT